MTRGSFLLTLLLAAAAAASWLLSHRAEEDATTSASIESADLGYYLTDARIVGLDDDGRALYTLHAERMEQRAGDGGVTMYQVMLDYAAGPGSAWTAEADTARIPASGELVELEGDVLLARSGSDEPRLEVATTILELAVLERVVRTAAVVDLTQGADTVRATGLEADLQTETVRLLSRVRGSFQSGAT